MLNNNNSSVSSRKVSKMKNMIMLIIVGIAAIVLIGIIVVYKLSNPIQVVSPIHVVSADAKSVTSTVISKSTELTSLKGETLLEQCKRLGVWDTLTKEQRDLVLAESTQKCGAPILIASGDNATINFNDANGKAIFNTNIKDSELANSLKEAATIGCKGKSTCQNSSTAKKSTSTSTSKTQPSVTVNVPKSQPSVTVNVPKSSESSSKSEPQVVNNYNPTINNTNNNDNDNDNKSNATNQNTNNINNGGTVQSTPSSSTPSSSTPSSTKAKSRITSGRSYYICDKAKGNEIKANILIYGSDFVDPEEIASSISASGLQMEGTVRYDGKNSNGRVYVVYFTIPDKAGTYTITLNGTSKWESASTTTKIA